MRLRPWLMMALLAAMTVSPCWAGSITGRVTFIPDGEIPTRQSISMAADPRCQAQHLRPVPDQRLLLGRGRGLANVFVQVKNPPAVESPRPASRPVVIEMDGCLYVPRVAGVQTGGRIRFKNSDGIPHNVHGLPKENREFNIRMPPRTTKTSRPLSKPEPIFRVKCDVHPWMDAYVAVMTHPYYAVTDRSGQFRIEGLPPGQYEIEAWHERLGVQRQSLTVDRETDTPARFSFKPSPRR